MNAVTEPFTSSRRLTGANFHFPEPGAVLEARPATPEVLAAWARNIARMRDALGWEDGATACRVHAGGATLAFTAPPDQLYTATEMNEWALLAALLAAGQEAGPLPCAPGHPAAWDEAAATRTLRAAARAERDPLLTALIGAASRHRINVLIDDDTVSLGSGTGAHSWPRAALPTPDVVPWNHVADVPAVLVTGSNGKTTVTRLLAAVTRAHGWHVAWSSTEGVYKDGALLDAGDYSGPGGARLALAQRDIDAAILETARGGLLRRGLALDHAATAIVTNISDDHFGEYGIDGLDDLAEAKLIVRRALHGDAPLIVNADDALLLRHARAHAAPLALFALDADAAPLQALRAAGGTTCGGRGGQLMLEVAGASTDLGAIAAMPLSFGGAARYNIANLAAAALAAAHLGIPAATLREVFARFGARRSDNPGRLERFDVGGIAVFIDFAHNPDGLTGLLAAASQNGAAPLRIVLGQAGDRSDAEMRALAAVAARHAPVQVVLKDIAGYLRGRAPGEVPRILAAALRDGGVPAARIETVSDEADAARLALACARPGDTLVLQMLVKDNREQLARLLAALEREHWHAGAPLPPAAADAGWSPPV